MLRQQQASSVVSETCACHCNCPSSARTVCLSLRRHHASAQHDCLGLLFFWGEVSPKPSLPTTTPSYGPLQCNSRLTGSCGWIRHPLPAQHATLVKELKRVQESSAEARRVYNVRLQAAVNAGTASLFDGLQQRDDSHALPAFVTAGALSLHWQHRLHGWGGPF